MQRREAQGAGEKARQAEVGERRSEVRRADGDERRDAVGEPQPRDGEARVESAHAVRDDVDAPFGQLAHQRDQLLGPLCDASHRRQAQRVELCALEALGDVAEIPVAPSGDGDLVEPEDPVRQHHRMAQPRSALRREPAPQPLAPHPRPDDESQRREQDRGKDQEWPTRFDAARS